MTVKEFIELYRTCLMTKNFDKCIEKLNVKKYISYAEKIRMCDEVVQKTYFDWKKDDDGFFSNTGIIHVNSPLSYMFFYLRLIDKYTDINIDFDNSVYEYDILNENGCVDFIINLVDERELKELIMVNEMVKEDAITNNYEIHAMINNYADRFIDVVKNIGGPMIELLTSNIKEGE